MRAKDIMVDETDGFLIEDGDFKIDYSDGQHIKHILQTYKGAWLSAPDLGVGALSYLNSGEIQRLEQDVKIDLRRDNYKFVALEVTVDGDQTDFNINAERIK